MAENVVVPAHHDRQRSGSGEYVRVSGATAAPARIVCVVEPSPMAALLVETIAGLLPGASVSDIDPASNRETPRADCLVIDSSVGGVPAIEVLRVYRARGFEGSAVLLVDGNGTGLEHAASSLGAARCVATSDLVAGLGDAIVAALQLRDKGTAGSASATALVALRQMQRLRAIGEIGRGLQHSLNNPLAALLAEAQLLELEELPPEHRESVERIVELTRRVISLVRGLDGTAEG